MYCLKAIMMFNCKIKTLQYCFQFVMRTFYEKNNVASIPNGTTIALLKP